MLDNLLIVLEFAIAQKTRSVRVKEALDRVRAMREQSPPAKTA